MLLVALTGNIASGKSTVATALAERGATLIDSDRAAREVVAAGTPALAAIVGHLGAAMLLPDGSLDRAALGRVVFRNADKRQALEQIVHPAVESARLSAIEAARERNARIVICDIPLLFEVRLAWHFPRIVLVDAPLDVRVARMVRDRGLPAADAMARASAQMPSSLKRCRADIVLDNGGERAALETALETAWRRLDAWAAVADPLRAL